MKILEFPLAWRWTDSRYSVLPTAVLAQLQPLVPDEARRAFERAQQFQKAPRIAHSADVSDEDGRTWLREQHDGMSDFVTIVWSPECALRTTWQIFTDYWSDFCYPSSDNVALWPESERWALFYDHKEQFEFVPRALA